MSKPPVKSRFDSSGLPQAPYTSTLSSLMRTVLRSYGLGLRVCLPARVEAVNSSYSVDVRPGFLEVHGQSPSPTPMPLLPGVPVSMPHGAKFAVRYPITVGDTGYVLIADRNIDTWLAGSGGPVTPGDPRAHDLTDAIFVPGLLTTNAATAAQDISDDLVVSSGLASLRLQPRGAFVIGNGVAKLVTEIREIAVAAQQLTAVLQSIIPPAGGPVIVPPPLAATAISTLSGITGQLTAAIAKIITLEGI